MERKQKFHGILKLWHEAGYGFIVRIGVEKMERYFLPASGIVSSPTEPKAGMHVYFDVTASKPRIPNGCPVAGNAEIFVVSVVQAAGSAVLAKPLPESGTAFAEPIAGIVPVTEAVPAEPEAK